MICAFPDCRFGVTVGYYDSFAMLAVARQKYANFSQSQISPLCARTRRFTALVVSVDYFCACVALSGFYGADFAFRVLLLNC